MTARDLRRYYPLSQPVEGLLREAVGLGRAYHRILKIGRTIADLAGEDELSTIHISEAIQRRPRTRGSKHRQGRSEWSVALTSA